VIVPAYAVLPDSREPEGFRVVAVPPEQPCFRFATVPPFRFDDRAKFAPVETVALDVVRFGRAERLQRRERRQRARANGRRRAVAVPFETRWEARVAAHPDVPQAIVVRVVEERAEVIERVWDRRALRRR
jgi:hypothetical protein